MVKILLLIQVSLTQREQALNTPWSRLYHSFVYLWSPTILLYIWSPTMPCSSTVIKTDIASSQIFCRGAVKHNANAKSLLVQQSGRGKSNPDYQPIPEFISSDHQGYLYLYFDPTGHEPSLSQPFNRHCLVVLHQFLTTLVYKFLHFSSRIKHTTVLFAAGPPEKQETLKRIKLSCGSMTTIRHKSSVCCSCIMLLSAFLFLVTSCLMTGSI